VVTAVVSALDKLAIPLGTPVVIAAIAAIANAAIFFDAAGQNHQQGESHQSHQYHHTWFDSSHV
jgi:hypothetical protein